MKTRPKTNRGSTLFVVLFFMALLSVFVGASFSLTSTTANVGARSTQMAQAYAVADSAMELVFSRWRSVVSFSTNKNLNAKVFIDSTSALNSESKDITQVTLADLGLPAGYLGLPSSTTALAAKVTIKTVDAAGRIYGSYDSEGRCLDDAARPVEGTRRSNYDATSNDFYPPPPSAGADYSFRVASPNANGFQSVEMVYRIESTVTLPTRTTPIVAQVRRHYTRSVASAAQAAYFYEDRLEIIPGTTTSIKGRVHTNKDLWIGDRMNISLDFYGPVTYAEAIVKRVNPIGAGDVTFQTGDFDLMFHGGKYTPRPKMSVGGINREALKPYIGTGNRAEQNLSYNNNSLREIIEIPATAANKDPADVFADAGSSYEGYWGINNRDSDQRAIEEARAYKNSDIKILLAFGNDGNLNFDKTLVRGRLEGSNADGPNAATSTPTEPLTTAGAAYYIKEALRSSVTYSGKTFGPILISQSRVAIGDRREAINGDTVMGTRIDISELKRAIEALYFTEVSTGTWEFTGVDVPSASVSATPKKLIPRRMGSSNVTYSGQVYIADCTYGSDGNKLPASYNPTLYMTGPDGASIETTERNPASGRVKHALVLERGNSLPASFAKDEADRNFTLATHNAVYIKGDYNVGGQWPSGQDDPTMPSVPSNTSVTGCTASTVVLIGGDPTKPYPTVAAAILADAVTVVSRKFVPADANLDIAAVVVDGSNNAVLGANGLPQLRRGAVSTTVNVAIVTGQYQSNDNGYSGGAANIIRFLENWTLPNDPLNTTPVIDGVRVYRGGAAQQRFTYRGSIMQSYTSREFPNKFLTPSTYYIYSPPQRCVYFDESFLVTPPVGFPGTITYTKGAWERPTG